MKLQLALDCESLAAARAVLEATADLVDIAEVGTPLVLREGTAAVRALKSAFPRVAILADFKIMDAGAEEAAIAFEAGADIVTVLAAAETVTIRRACEVARTAGREVMADLIAVADPARRAAEVAGEGVDYLCCHTAFDTQRSGAARWASWPRCAPRCQARGLPLPAALRRSASRGCSPSHPRS